jgi:hypothetical protein
MEQARAVVILGPVEAILDLRRPSDSPIGLEPFARVDEPL